MRRFLLYFIPKTSLLRRVVLKVLYKIGLEPKAKQTEYNNWFRQLESANFYDPSKVNEDVKISIVVPCYNTPKYQFEEMVYSVVNQYYQNWELVIANASDRKLNYISEANKIDTRIKVVGIENKGIAQNTNEAIKLSTGEYVALLDHDDMLTQDALSSVARVINDNPGCDFIYSDEDKVDENRRYYKTPLFKPNFSPELLENVNYITHFSVIKKSTIEKVGGLNEKTNGAQDYDLFLRLVDSGAEVVHIPRVLYHWRTAKKSTANNINAKDYIFKSGEHALNNHLMRTGQKAVAVSIAGMPGFYEIVYQNKEKVATVFMIKDNIVRQAKFINEWLNAQDKARAGIVYAPNEVVHWFSEQNIQIPKNVSGYENTPDLKKQIDLSSAKVCIIYTAYIKIDSFDKFAKSASGLLEKSDVFSVSPLILDASGRIKDAGYIKNSDGCLEKIFVGKKLEDQTQYGYHGWVRNVDAPSVDLFATRAKDLAEHSAKELLHPRRHVAVKSGRSVLWAHQKALHLGSPLAYISKTDFGSPLVQAVSTNYDYHPLPDISHEEVVK